MRKLLISILFIPGIIYASANSTIFDDNTWYYGDFTLKVHKHEPFVWQGKTYDYSMSYVYSEGNGSYDTCTLSSPTSISCIDGSSITYSSKSHSVTLRSRGTTLVYYEKDYMPKLHPLSGTWRFTHAEYQECGGMEVKIVIPKYYEKNTTRFEWIVEDVFYPGAGSNAQGEDYDIVKDRYTGQLGLGTRATKYSDQSISYYFYDINDEPITDLENIYDLAKLYRAQLLYIDDNHQMEGKIDPSMYNPLCSIEKQI